VKFIEEIVVEEFLPTFRSLLAERLRDRGLTQSEVAGLLGISQSAVSKYVHGDVERNDDLLAGDELIHLVDRLADRLADGDMTPVEALIEAEVAVRESERGGALAELHAEAVPELAEYDGAAIHAPEGRLRETGRVRASVRRGLRILRNTGGFAGQIPAVGSNLVECLPGAETIADVAAVPGRILDVRGEVTIPGDPAFGVSEHVASVLLAARAGGTGARAAVNVAYSETTVEALAAAGHEPVAFDAEADLDGAVADALAEQPDADVLYHAGAMGIEPIVYVLGPDAPAVAERVGAVT
jgi:predicted fused transcriptional regulator/phosphomethylpyrimidine kinase/predicted transcriptional regulator